MTYQVLARKWRPTHFGDLVGQEHVLRALVHGLDQDRLHQAFLFTGTRGVGKTTIGRILARCLSCEQGISSQPCGECGNCREILDGRFVDLIEIDAASQTRVEDMRELLDNVQYAPSHGRFRIYLIDEVHMLSGHSFNALLKTLEEPPDHVKFLLATTDPQKLPVTILSRCLQFNLKRLSAELISAHLAHVLDEEGVNYENNALWLLARGADGSMRDALSLTDQAIAYSGGELDAGSVSQMLGTVDRADVFRILEALISGDGPGLLSESRRISDFSPDYGAILADLLDVFHRIALEQAVPESVDNAQGDRERIRDLAASLSPEDAQLFYQTALIARRDMEITPDAQMGFEMALLRMLAFRPGTGGEPPQGDARGASESAAASAVAAPDSDIPAESVPADEPDAGSVPAVDGAEALSPVGDSEVVESDAQLEPEHEPEPEPEPEPEREPEPEPEPELDIDQAQATGEFGGAAREVAETASGFDWCRDFGELGLQGMAETLAANASCHREESAVWVLTMAAGHYQLLHARHAERIRAALTTRIGDDARVEFREGNPLDQTPVAYRESLAAERRESAVTAIRGDPIVQQIVERFEGQVIEDSIQPLDPAPSESRAS